jgi:hypothetical protein
MADQRWRVWVLGAVIALQVAVPAVALTLEPPTRFGFQMYSGYGDGEIGVLDASGAAIDVDYAEVLPRSLRPELDWTRHVPEHLCAKIPGAATIVVEQNGSGRTDVPCA